MHLDTTVRIVVGQDAEREFSLAGPVPASFTHPELPLEILLMRPIQTVIASITSSDLPLEPARSPRIRPFSKSSFVYRREIFSGI